MFVKVPKAPMHRPHRGEQNQIIPGIEGCAASKGATLSPKKDTIIAFLAVIRSPRIPKTTLPPIPPKAKILIAVAAVVELMPSLT